ncbi:uncharacterized protein N7483_012113 [Penicillium malachiteum]|uniref:uncharacterized protein n=1 Tax=Penicillium malachiteum TaxID=1324776 RepID=UPI0025471E34|nr:uncharacterized protein N7483_012113 [Penicillium malachiteum]KAJ5714932.1 hypothetical protein N7483_012113 [Penicillium malachiteum]
MTPRLDLAPRRTRESTSKVRTGCSTCKARRVKCDELKPICQRCAIGGRKCEYNTARTAPRRTVFTVYLPPTQSQPVFFVNYGGLDFFHQSIASKLDGQFDSQFWSKLVLQLSHSEPSIRHAVSAISVIYRDVDSSLLHPAGYVNANPEAQQEWNTAVKSLSARIETHPNSILVPLVCCLLFTCIEFLRGNGESSLLHVQSGFKILAALHRKDHQAPGSGSSISTNDHKTIEDHIIPIFSRLNVLCSLAGIIIPPVYASTANSREDFPHEDLGDSRQRLVEDLDLCIRFIHDAILKADMFQINVDDLIEQAKLQARLEVWRNQLDELLERKQAAGNMAKQDALNILLVHYKIIYIWIRVCTTAGEMATDSYHVDFEELVHYAEQIAKPGMGMETPQSLSFDMQILGPLYFTALKCRHPAIRRRALEMLQLAPRREGLWNAHYAYVTAKRVIQLEERDLNGHELPNETSRVRGLPLPDDEARIYSLGEMSFEYRKFDHNVIPSPTCPGILEAVFQTKPWGEWGEPQTITEYIKL